MILRWRSSNAQVEETDPPVPPPVVDVRTLLIGVGSQKSGTTWLSRVLGRHPSVHKRKKEVHYWDVIRYPYSRWDSMAGWQPDGSCAKGEFFGQNPYDHGKYYDFLTERRYDRPVCMDFSPSYALCRTSTFREMMALHDDVKFVFLMRDPVQRLWSGIRHRMSGVLRVSPDFDGLERAFLSACENPHDPDLLRSRYDLTIAALEEAGANVHYEFFESLFEPQAMERLFTFLGLEAPAEVAYEKKANEGVVQTSTLSDKARQIARETLAPCYDDVFRRFSDAVPSKWREA
jgi:hypothetical protein